MIRRRLNSRGKIARLLAALCAVAILAYPAARAAAAERKASDPMRQLLDVLTPEARAMLPGDGADLDPQGHELAQVFLAHLAEDGRVSYAGQKRSAPDQMKRQQDRIDELLQNKVNLLGGYEPQDVGDPINWFTAPRGDMQWPVHLSRHYWLKPLVYAYLATGDEKYAERVMAALVDWTRRTPLDSPDLFWRTAKPAGKSGRMVSEGFFGQYADGPWTSLSAHARVEEWSWLLALLHESKAATNERVAVLLHSLFTDHFHSMLAHKRGMNQFQGIATSLIHLGWWYPWFQGHQEALETGWQRLTHYARTEIYPDGSMAECSPNYAKGCLGRLYSMIKQARERGEEVPEVMTERAALASRYFALIADPRGNAPRIAKGKSTVHKVCDWINKEFQDPVVEYIVSEGKSGTRPDALSHAFPWAGHIVMRSAWEPRATWLFFEPGPRGSGHMDLACLNFQLQHRGKWILTDPGYYSYSGSGEDGAMSLYLRSTAAHNTAIVDGRGQIRRPPGTGWGGPNKEPGDYGYSDDGETVRARGAYTYGYGENGEIQVVHRRELVYRRPEARFVITDRFEGQGSHRIALHWQMRPEAKVEARGDALHIENGQAKATLSFQASAPLALDIVKGSKGPLLGWYSETYGRLAEAPTGRVALEGDLPITVTTTIQCNND